MANEIRVVQYGLGPIGSAIARLIHSRDALKLVGGVDIAPEKVGTDLGDAIGLGEKLGVPVAKTLAEALSAAPADVVVHTTSSYFDLFSDQIREILEAGLDVVVRLQVVIKPKVSFDGLDDAELAALKEALDQQTLFYAAGSQVKTFCREFASLLGVRHCIATSSGTAAIHVALGALGVSPGDEVITVPITDMGTLIGILFQNAIPVFCDIEPDTYSMDIDDLKRKISDRTKAIIPVHLSGNPNDMEPILDVANRHGIPVVEDCAQAYLAEYKGRPVGTWGTRGC